jgi:hypothetical protein
MYHTLSFIIPAIQSENYKKKSKLKYLLLIDDIEMVNCCFVAIINRVSIIVQNVGEFVVT